MVYFNDARLDIKFKGWMVSINYRDCRIFGFRYPGAELSIGMSLSDNKMAVQPASSLKEQQTVSLIFLVF